MDNNMREIRHLEKIAMVWFMNAISCNKQDYLKETKRYSEGVVNGLFTSINLLGDMEYDFHLRDAIRMDIERG
jgi:hypothetical protein